MFPMSPVVHCRRKAAYHRASGKNEFRLTKKKSLWNTSMKRQRSWSQPLPEQSHSVPAMSREDLEAIAEVVRGKRSVCPSDEIYAEPITGGNHVSFASLPGMKERDHYHQQWFFQILCHDGLALAMPAVRQPLSGR